MKANFPIFSLCKIAQDFQKELILVLKKTGELGHLASKLSKLQQNFR